MNKPLTKHQYHWYFKIDWCSLESCPVFRVFCITANTVLTVITQSLIIRFANTC